MSNRFLWLCLHRWETTKRSVKSIYGAYDVPGSDIPVKQLLVYEQSCIHCGKSIVRKYRA